MALNHGKTARREARKRKKIRNDRERAKYERIGPYLFFLLMPSVCFSGFAFKHTYLPWKRHVYQPVELKVLEREVNRAGRVPTRYFVVNDPATGRPYRAADFIRWMPRLPF